VQGAVGLVAISRSQRALNPGLNWIGTVHNGIDVGSYPFSREKDDYLLWLGPDVDIVGEADGALRRRLLARARALLFPIQWEESFGIVNDDFASFVAGIDAATDLDPDACRRHAERLFDRSVMGSGYERVFRAVADHDVPRTGRDARDPRGLDALA